MLLTIGCFKLRALSALKESTLLLIHGACSKLLRILLQDDLNNRITGMLLEYLDLTVMQNVFCRYLCLGIRKLNNIRTACTRFVLLSSNVSQTDSPINLG